MVPIREFVLAEAFHDPDGNAGFAVGKLAGWKTGVTEPAQFMVPMHVREQMRALHEPSPVQALFQFSLAAVRPDRTITPMFSHIVVFWTDPARPHAVDELVSGVEKHLKQIPGIQHFHAGRMVPSLRSVVDQTYQVALNVVFPDRKTQDEYQVHPQHLEFVDKFVKRLVQKVVVYDFE